MRSAVEQRVAAALARNPSYAGSFDRVDVSVLRLSYSIENLRLVKRGGRIPVPFVIAPFVEYRFDWTALARGGPAGEIALANPTLNLVDGPTPEDRQFPHGHDWRVTLRKLFPTNVNGIDVRGGTIHFRNFHSEPVVDVYLANVALTGKNLPSLGPAGDRTIELIGRGVPMHSGAVTARFTLMPSTRRPSFDGALLIEGARLAEWNSLIRAYGGVDVTGGSSGLDAHIESRDGAVDGYVNASVADLDALNLPRELSVQAVSESVRGTVLTAVAAALEGPGRDAIMFHMPVAGTITRPRGDFWVGLGSLVENAFVQARRSVFQKDAPSP